MNPDNKSGQSNQPAQQESMGFDKYVAIALVVGLIAGFVIGQSAGSNTKKVDKNATSTGSDMIFGEEQEDENSTTMAGDSMKSVDEEIKVDEQKAGNTVTISRLVLDKSYWVAIRDSQISTKKPYILGSKRLTAGTYTDLSIYVSRATEVGKKYDIVFYKDGPTFNYSSSMMVRNGDSVSAATFEIK